jgi:hypothetical protein
MRPFRTHHAFLHERGRYDQRQADHEDPAREGGKPVGKLEVVREDTHDLEGHPRGEHVDPENLPERAAVDLADKLLEAVHRSASKEVGRHADGL